MLEYLSGPVIKLAQQAMAPNILEPLQQSREPIIVYADHLDILFPGQLILKPEIAAGRDAESSLAPLSDGHREKFRRILFPATTCEDEPSAQIVSRNVVWRQAIEGSDEYVLLYRAVNDEGFPVVSHKGGVFEYRAGEVMTQLSYMADTGGTSGQTGKFADLTTHYSAEAFQYELDWISSQFFRIS